MRLLLSICFAGLLIQVAAVRADAPASVHHISQARPFSCAQVAQDLTGTSACLGDAGSYQMARLGLSIEAFAGALAAAGTRDDMTAIQNTLYADIAKFGIELSLIGPA